MVTYLTTVFPNHVSNSMPSELSFQITEKAGLPTSYEYTYVEILLSGTYLSSFSVKLATSDNSVGSMGTSFWSRVTRTALALASLSNGEWGLMK